MTGGEGDVGEGDAHAGGEGVAADGFAVDIEGVLEGGGAGDVVHGGDADLREFAAGVDGGFDHLFAIGALGDAGEEAEGEFVEDAGVLSGGTVTRRETLKVAAFGVLGGVVDTGGGEGGGVGVGEVAGDVGDDDGGFGGDAVEVSAGEVSVVLDE